MDGLRELIVLSLMFKSYLNKHIFNNVFEGSSIRTDTKYLSPGAPQGPLGSPGDSSLFCLPVYIIFSDMYIMFLVSNRFWYVYCVSSISIVLPQRAP